MEDLTPADGTPAASPLPQALDDPQDPLRPEIEEEDALPTPPRAFPQQDMEVTEEADQNGLDNDEDEDDDDNESVLSEIDEAQFEDFDPNAVSIEARPVAVDQENIGLIGVHKRKRKEGEGGTKKTKEGRRDRPKKARRSREDDDVFAGGEEVDGKRSRRNRDAGEKPERTRRKATPENEDLLTPEERRKRALDRKMDEALRTRNTRRTRQDGIDLEKQNDDLIENMRRRMTDAAKADNDARQAGLPAMKKLQMLPEVVALLNRNTLREQLVDPDTNLLEAVRFFLEPLNDGSLPAYNIQRELFGALERLPINKDALVASGIGKVMLFYTKSGKPEVGIKRLAERMVGEWSRPILKRSDDYRKRELTEAVYNPHASQVRASQPQSSQSAAALAVAAARERQLAAPVRQNRARVEGGLSSYHIVPKNNILVGGQVAQRMGAGGDKLLRRLERNKGGRR